MQLVFEFGSNDTPGLSVACLGNEQGVELADAQQTEETFPWSQWP